MCGRYNIATNAKALHDAFRIINEQLDGSELDFSNIKPHYNISPTAQKAPPAAYTYCPVIRLHDNSARVDHLLWPLVPKWAKGIVTKYSTANAKCETLSSTNSFKGPWLHSQRCLIPATGFYEWQLIASGKPKQPFHIQVKNRDVFAMAGLWESSPDKLGNTIESFTIITTAANPLMARIHNTNQRMPVILDPEQYVPWLTAEPEQAQAMLHSYPETNMQAYKISTYVNNPGNDSEQCVAPLQEQEH